MRTARSASSFVLIFGVTFRLLFLGALHLEAATDLMSVSSKPDASKRASIQESFGKLPLYFIENRGQEDTRVAYYVEGADKSIYFTPSGVTFMLTQKTPESKESGRGDLLLPASFKTEPREPNPESNIEKRAVTLDFLGGNPDVKITGDEKTPAVVSYFDGPQSEWKAGLATYASIKYHDVWPGIDLVYRGTVNQLKYEFIVNPGADPRVVKLAYNGADVKLSDSGDLEVSSPEGGFQDQRPHSYQIVDGQTKEVRSAYDGLRDDAAGRHVYGFDVGRYDKSRPLVIDPVVLVYTGIFGQSGYSTTGSGIAVDAAGSAYVTGTSSYYRKAFVIKVNPAGHALVYKIYIGYDDTAGGIAVDTAGNAYVTGSTTSDHFPVFGGPDLSYNGGVDAFIVKVNPFGELLDYAGYIGGSGDDYGAGIAVDTAGNAYVTGHTTSDETTFPVVGGPDLTYNGPDPVPGWIIGGDAFVVKVNATGTSLVYAGYIGGSETDQGFAIAVNTAGNAYVAGHTISDETTFPVVGGPDLTYNGPPPTPGYSDGDAFVAKLNGAGTALVYAGYLGGSSDDRASGIAADTAGNAYVTGYTASDETTFPVVGGPDLTYNGAGDAFVAEVKPAGTSLVYAGYIGGSNRDSGDGVAVDSAGNAYVAGSTGSDQTTFPVINGPDLTYNGAGDAFVAKVDAAGTALVYGGYIGWSYIDGGSGIALDTAGNAYVTGSVNYIPRHFPNPGSPPWALVAKVGIAPCIFCDDFEDGDYTNPAWTPNGGSWSVISGNVVGSDTKKGYILSPSFDCTECTFEARMSVQATGRVSLFAWRLDSKHYVEVRLMQDKQKIFVKQKSGALSTKSSAKMTINPDQLYDVAIKFNGTNFQISVDGLSMPELTLTPVATPSGDAEFEVKSTTGKAVSGSVADFSVY